jgi:UDP-N-acetyl-D-galactosamine dehydrogenase
MNKKIAVIGLGYVGLPLAAAFSEKYTVLAYDNDAARVKELNNGWDRIEQMTKADLVRLQTRLTFSDDAESLSDCNIFIITVPTPVTSDKKPDLFF